MPTPTKRSFTAWNGFSLNREATYGTAIACAVALNNEGGFADVNPNNVVTDENEDTGYNEPAEHTILDWMGQQAHSQRLLPIHLGLFGGLCLGKVTSFEPDNANNPGIYRHYMERDLASALMKSVTAQQYDGITKKEFPGTVCEQVQITLSRGQHPRIQANLKNRGEQAATTDAKPSGPAESYLRPGDANILRGGALSGSVAGDDLAVGSGPTSIKGKVKQMGYTLSNGAEGIPELGDASGYMSRFEYGDRWTHDLSLDLEMQDDSDRAALIAGTEYVLDIPLVGGVIAGGDGSFNYTARLIFPRVVYSNVGQNKDGKKVGNTSQFTVLEDATYGSIIMVAINKVAAFLATP